LPPVFAGGRRTAVDGNPYDNARSASFIKTLKAEEVDGTLHPDRHEAARCIGTFINQVYNKQSLHSGLGYRPHAEFEALHRGLGQGVGDAGAIGSSAPPTPNLQLDPNCLLAQSIHGSNLSGI
jgi:hypothetical protein